MKETVKIIAILLVATFARCEEEIKVAPPAVDTESVEEITGTSAKVGGRVNSDGGAEITDRGVYWGPSAKPETTGTKLQSGSGTGIFHETLTGLSPGVKYYVTAYAVNSSGASYGSETFFTTQISMPVVSTASVTEFTETTARVGGDVTADGGFEISVRGIFWGTEPNPRLTGSKVVAGSGMGSFSITLQGLSRANTYYVVAFATNIKGTSYGEEISFKTEPEAPVVYTSPVTGIKTHSASAGGNVSSDGGSEVIERGIWWGTTANPEPTGSKIQAGAGTGNFIIPLVLEPGKKYFYKAYAINSVGTTYGDEKFFSTLGDLPKIDTVYITQLHRERVRMNFQVDSSDLNTTVWIEYGSTDQYGSSTTQMTIPAANISNNDTTVYFEIPALTALTYYHFRAIATNELGQAETRDYSFRTVMTGLPGSVTIDGITYATIGIGFQEWMTSNLRSVKDIFNNKIPAVDSLWTTGTASRSWYQSDSSNYAEKYGALYNWNAVNELTLCPAGWNVPSMSDVVQLTSFIGGAESAGEKLRQAGTAYWNSPNTGASNAYDFDGRGGGKRYMDGSYDLLKVEGNWWIRDEYSTLNAWYFSMMYDKPNVFMTYYNKKTGMSVRCVKNH